MPTASGPADSHIPGDRRAVRGGRRRPRGRSLRGSSGGREGRRQDRFSQSTRVKPSRGAYSHRRRLRLITHNLISSFPDGIQRPDREAQTTHDYRRPTMHRDDRPTDRRTGHTRRINKKPGFATRISVYDMS
jgi:hypothetical protein